MDEAVSEYSWKVKFPEFKKSIVEENLGFITPERQNFHARVSEPSPESVGTSKVPTLLGMKARVPTLWAYD